MGKRLPARRAVFAGTTPNPYVCPARASGASFAARASLTRSALAAPPACPARSPPAWSGRLEPGAPADLLVLREDPTRNLGALATLEAVIADGRLYTRAQLDAQLTRYQKHSEGVLYDAVSMLLVRRALARALD